MMDEFQEDVEGTGRGPMEELSLQGLRKTKENFSHDSRSPGLDMNRAPSKYFSTLST
jgi:hypothetical protein